MFLDTKTLAESPLKQQNVAGSVDSDDPQEHMSLIIQAVLRAACDRPEGLLLRVGMRGRKRVSENLTFRSSSLTDVKVRADFTFVLIMGNERFWIQSKEDNCAALREIQGYQNQPSAFEFPEHIVFYAVEH